MSDDSNARDGELLAAYLAGDLDDDAAAELERRLADEPALGTRLDATHAVIEQLSRFDDMEPPEGFGDRLRARLDEERAPAAADARPVGSPASLEDARARRSARTSWPALGAVAAGLVGVALLAGVAVVGFGANDEIWVAEDAAEEAPQLEALDADDEMDADVADEPGVLAERALPDEPELRDSSAPLDDADAVRTHIEGTPAEELMGLPVEDARELAAAFSVAVQRADTFQSGLSPAACLDALVADVDQPVVPVVVERVAHEDAEALLYVVATARVPADVLDRVEAWVMEPDGCATRLYVELPR